MTICECGHSWFRHIPGDESDGCSLSECKCISFREIKKGDNKQQMQTQIVVKDSVQGKFGPQLVDNKGFLSFGKFYVGDKEFAPNTILDVELYVTDKGSRYINKANIVSQEVVKRGRKPKSEMPGIVGTTLPENVYKPRDYDKENRGKVKSLFIEALLSNPNILTELSKLNELNSIEIQNAINKLVESVF